MAGPTLPPLNAIRAFEVAARHLNFVAAAEELGVTQSAISKQIAILEDRIGGRLFERGPRGVALTLEGRELMQTVLPAFELLRSGFTRYSRRPPRSNKVRIATVISYASHILMPRLGDFERNLPELELEVLTSDRVLDLAREEIDLSIRYGQGAQGDLVSHQLSSGRLVPVCQPELFRSHKADTLALSQSSRRIQLFPTDEWSLWTRHNPDCVDVSARAFATEHFLVARQAVMAGTGFALLPEILVGDDLRAGRLVSLGPPIDWSQAFHLIYRPKVEEDRQIRSVIAWLKDIVRDPAG